METSGGKKTVFDSFCENLNKKVSKSTKSMAELVKTLIEVIKNKNFKKLCEISENGIPDDLPIMRAYVWKILLGYLPIDSAKWDETLQLKRKDYKVYRKLIKDKLKKELEQQNYKSKEILEQIVKDAYRTNSQLSFFFQSTDRAKPLEKEQILKIYEKRRKWDFSKMENVYIYDNIEYETHADVLVRILFTYSCLIPAISYHQGMNELLAVIYYCYSYDKLYIEEKEEDIEADSFWSFYFLMEKIKNNFDQEGIFYKSGLLGECLEIVDNDIFTDLQDKNIKNEYFSCRWFIMLLSQDFEIWDVVRLWDLILCKENKNYYLFYICLGILIYRKNIILNGDMPEILQRFQSLQDIFCDALIVMARDIKNNWHSKIDNIITKSEKEF